MNEHTFPIRYFLPPEFCQSFFELFFPITIQLMGDHTSFVQEDHGIFNAFPRFGPFVFVEDVSTHLDILIFERILSNLGASSNFTRVQADIASAACPSQLGNLIIFAAVIWDADEPFSVKTA